MELGHCQITFTIEEVANTIGNTTEQTKIFVRQNEELVFSDVVTRFHRDPYNARVAEKKLLARFFQHMEFPQNTRYNYWQQYRNSVPRRKW